MYNTITYVESLASFIHVSINITHIQKAARVDNLINVDGTFYISVGGPSMYVGGMHAGLPS